MMPTYTCFKTEEGLWLVGYFDRNGEWIVESTHETEEGASDRAKLLNMFSQFGSDVFGVK